MDVLKFLSYDSESCIILVLVSIVFSHISSDLFHYWYDECFFIVSSILIIMRLSDVVLGID